MFCKPFDWFTMILQTETLNKKKYGCMMSGTMILWMKIELLIANVLIKCKAHHDRENNTQQNADILNSNWIETGIVCFFLNLILYY